MKFFQLKFAGFGPFLAEQCIDFSRLDAAGVFLIAGKTGAGKSTILDAIVFALYGTVPRYAGRIGRVRSTFATPTDRTWVELVFDHGDTRYRITRSPEYEREKRTSPGTTTVPARQRLERWIAGADGWQTITIKAAEVASELRNIFPLSADEFLQVVLLAQGDFQRFLHADSKTRQNLLRKLFNSHRFDRLRALAQERAQEAHQQSEQLSAALTEIAKTLQLEDATPTEAMFARLVNDADRAVTEARGSQQDAEHHAQITAAALREVESVHERQQRRNRAAERLSLLESDQQRIDREVVLPLRTDRAASPLLPLLAVHDETQHALELATATLTDAELALHTQQNLPETIRFVRSSAGDALAESLTDTEQQLDEYLGVLRMAVPLDSEVTAAVAATMARADERDALTAELMNLREQLRAQPEQLQALRTQLTTADAITAQETRVREQLQLQRAQLAAAQRAELLTVKLAQAQQQLQQALTAAADARAAEADLYERRLRGSAATLAARLTPNEPCPVCGALTHPAPAVPTETPVTEEQVAQAAHATQEASELESSRRTALDRVREDHTRQLAASGNLTSAAAQAQVTATELELATIQAASTQRAELVEQIELLEQQFRSTADRETQLATQQVAANEAATAAATTAQQLRSRHDKLRGGFETIRERLAVGEALSATVRETVRARERVERASDTAAIAQTKLLTALRNSDFATLAQVRAATLSPQRRENLEAQQEAHASALASVRSILAEPELQQLPAQAVDAQPARDADAAARAALARANAEQGSASERYRQVRAAVAQGRLLLQRSVVVQQQAQVRSQLAADLSGKNAKKLNLEAFVLTTYLDDIIDAANRRLEVITKTRYTLKRDTELAAKGRQSGLDLLVADLYSRHDRSPESLSGGETFLVSLALALGLADVVAAQAGGIELETLFIDEGFGSLDAETLEIAMRTLDELRVSGRTVGVISHVTSMHERIPTHIEVTRLPDQTSTLALRDALLE